MIRVGTSGFSYDDWPGNFYPHGTKPSGMFESYCAWFNTVELNTTFYGIPRESMMRALTRRAAGRVTFTAKMSLLITHEGYLRSDVVLKYHRAIAPLADSGKLGAILFQFPFRFHNTPENRGYLLQALGQFSALPSVVEIRHDSWQTDDGMNFFRDRGISLCVVDMPRLSRLPRTRLDLTGPIAYVRFHGRNGKHWFKDSYPGAPYDYFYSKAELTEWIEPIKQLNRKAQTTFAFFNNHIHAQAPRNARTFSQMLNGTTQEYRITDWFGAQASP